MGTQVGYALAQNNSEALFCSKRDKTIRVKLCDLRRQRERERGGRGREKEKEKDRERETDFLHM